MNELALITVLLGSMTVTSYRSLVSQTDNSPFITATGEHVHSNGVALSRDLLERWGGPVKYGDTILIEGFGMKVVNDCMNRRHKNHVDMWVRTYKEEKVIGWQKRNVWLIKTKTSNK